VKNNQRSLPLGPKKEKKNLVIKAEEGGKPRSASVFSEEVKMIKKKPEKSPGGADLANQSSIFKRWHPADCRGIHRKGK